MSENEDSTKEKPPRTIAELFVYLKSEFSITRQSIDDVKTELGGKIDKNAANIDLLTDRMTKLEERVLRTECEANSKEQRLRRCGMKLNGLVVDKSLYDDVGKLCDHIYTEFLTPIFELAVKAKRIDAVPKYREAIERMHPNAERLPSKQQS